MDLAQQLTGYGTPEQITNTVQRLKEKKNWNEFLANYPYGSHIQPYNIKKIVENYYASRPGPTSESASTSASRSLLGGKRKSRRSRKSKKSRKNRRKTNRHRR